MASRAERKRRRREHDAERLVRVLHLDVTASVVTESHMRAQEVMQSVSIVPLPQRTKASFRGEIDEAMKKQMRKLWQGLPHRSRRELARTSENLWRAELTRPSAVVGIALTSAKRGGTVEVALGPGHWHLWGPR